MKPEEAALLSEIAGLAREIPGESLVRVAQAVEQLPADARPEEWAKAVQAVVHGDHRDRLRNLLAAWRAVDLGGGFHALAWALRAAAHADEEHRRRQTIELVWTGPAPPGSQLRRTDQALLELIHAARQELIIVTFAAYKVPEIAAALEQAADRGVRISLILESTDDSGGKVRFDSLEALGVPQNARCTVHVWPLDRRPRDGAGRHGSLHAKCAVADDVFLLISIANLTEHALSLNMELGVLIRAGGLARLVAGHFRSLIQEGTLQPIT